MGLEAIKNKFNEVATLLNSRFADDVTEESAEATAETTEVEAQFMEVTLIDGETVISYEGELMEGVAIFMIVDGESIPATEGTLELGGEMEGVSIVVNAEGMVSEVIDAREETETAEEVVEEQAEAMSSEDVNAIVDESMSSISEPLNAIATGIESILKENSQLKSELETLKSDFNAFKELPSVEQVESNQFATADKLSKRQVFLKNKRK